MCGNVRPAKQAGCQPIIHRIAGIEQRGDRGGGHACHENGDDEWQRGVHLAGIEVRRGILRPRKQAERLGEEEMIDKRLLVAKAVARRDPEPAIIRMPSPIRYLPAVNKRICVLNN